MEMITAEQFEQMKTEKQLQTFVEATREAEKDETPYVGIVNDEIHVIGDVNKTEVKKHDYEISFAFPNTAEWLDALKKSGEIIEKQTENFLKVTRKFENVHLVPRRASSVVEAFTRVLSFLREVTIEGVDEKGEPTIEMRDLTEKEMLDMLTALNKDVEDSIYEAVGRFFGMSDAERDAMVLSSAMYNAVMIVVNNPEIINESDLFFG